MIFAAYFTMELGFSIFLFSDGCFFFFSKQCVFVLLCG